MNGCSGPSHRKGSWGYAGLVSLLILGISVGLVGCATVKKKFIRKKKERTVQPVAYLQEGFVKPYSNTYYYVSHFSYWKTWHDELLNNLGKNRKRQHRCITEAMGHLEEMKKYLKEPKRTELAALMDELQQESARLEDLESPSQIAQARPKLEKLGRLIHSGFSKEKVSGFILEDTIDLTCHPRHPQWIA